MKSEFFSNHQRFIYIYLFITFAILMATTIMLPHTEGDELIYQTLGAKLASFHLYSLQNTSLLKYLSLDIYNTPIFFRPPVFAVYLAVLYRLLGVLGFRIAPVIIYILLCFTIYKIVLQTTRSRNNALKALLLSTLSSLMLFSSVQIHLDLLMTLMAAVSFYFAMLFRGSRRVNHSFLSGLFLALAVLTNYTAAILYPFFFIAIAYKHKRNLLLISTFSFFLPVLLIILWFYILIIKFHMSPSSLFSAPSKQMLINSKFLNFVYHRPFYYYIVNIFVTNPLYLLILLLFKRDIWHILISHFGKIIYLLLIIISVIFISLTLYGMHGGTYQMRYILLAEPFLIILLSLIPFEKYETIWSYSLFIVLYNLLLVFYNVGYRNAELLTFFEMFKH